MANPILHPRYAMWAAAGLLTGCGLTLVVTRALDEDAATPHRTEVVVPERITPVLSPRLSMSPAVNPPSHTRASPSRCTEPGKVRGRSTSRHCCWYGQVWSSSESRCVGIPFKCPDGHAVIGEACAMHKPALTRRDVDEFLGPHQRLFRACATEHMSVYFESLSLDFTISSEGQALEIRPSAGQPWTRDAHNELLIQCVQDRLIALDFPQGHRVTHMRDVTTSTYITPELN